MGIAYGADEGDAPRQRLWAPGPLHHSGTCTTKAHGRRSPATSVPAAVAAPSRPAPLALAAAGRVPLGGRGAKIQIKKVV